MNYDEVLVGSLAIIIAIAAAAIAVGPWDQPYRLSSIAAIGKRLGKPMARGVWVAIAVALLTAGFAILSGLRPSYTDPAQRAQLDQP